MIKMLLRRYGSLAIVVLVLLVDRSFSAQTSSPGYSARNQQQKRDALRQAAADTSDTRNQPRASSANQHGEDIGANRVDPLLLVAQRMREAEHRIKNRDTSLFTQTLQKQNVADLTRLIDQLQQRSRGQVSSSRASTSLKTGTDRSQSEPNAAGTQAARDGESSLNQDHQVEVTDRSARHVIRRTWGHLPATLRESVLNAEFERFLPKYERLIEKYYQRLAEEEPR